MWGSPNFATPQPANVWQKSWKWEAVFFKNKRRICKRCDNGEWVYLYTDDHNFDTRHDRANVHVLEHIFILSLLNFQKRFCLRLANISLCNGESFFLVIGAMSCNSAWPYMFRLTTIQCIVATQHSVVTKLTIRTPLPLRKSLDPPLGLGACLVGWK